MARSNKGDALTIPQLQPGWKLSDDGYGLHTISAIYKYDLSLGFNWTRGEPFTVSEYNYCKLHKVNLSFDALGVITATAEYVGINPDINGGSFTYAQMTTAGGVTTEKIETIPNFTADFPGEPELMIAGPAPYIQSDLGPVVTSSTTTPPSKVQSYIGAHGACFENEYGGKFLGFVNPEHEYFYGKTSYLAAQQTFSGFIYIESDITANAFIENLGVSSGDGNWNANLPYIIPTYLNGPFTDPNNDYNQLLLTQANVESYGSLYKVTYEIKFSLNGWHPAIYPVA